MLTLCYEMIGARTNKPIAHILCLDGCEIFQNKSPPPQKKIKKQAKSRSRTWCAQEYVVSKHDK